MRISLGAASEEWSRLDTEEIADSAVGVTFEPPRHPRSPRDPNGKPSTDSSTTGAADVRSTNRPLLINADRRVARLAL
jgi:hypothetical protein